MKKRPADLDRATCLYSKSIARRLMCSQTLLCRICALESSIHTSKTECLRFALRKINAGSGNRNFVGSKIIEHSANEVTILISPLTFKLIKTLTSAWAF